MGEERTRSPWECAPLRAKAGAEDEESYGPNRQTRLGMDPPCTVPVGCPAGGGRHGAQGEPRRGRGVRLRRAAVQQLARPCPLFGARFCEKGRIKADNGIPVKVPAGKFSVLQLEQELHFQAIICKKKWSTMKAVCGASWHSKLVEPLDIQEPIRLSITECSDVGTTQIVTMEDGRQI